MNNKNLQGTSSSQMLGITVKPHGQLTGKASSFAKVVKDAGYVEINKVDIAIEGVENYLPHGFTGEHLTSAVRLYAQGATSKQLENLLDNKVSSLNLTESEEQSLYAIPYLVRVFEETNFGGFSRGLTKNIQAAQQPEVEFTYIPEPATPISLEGLNLFQKDQGQGIFVPIIKEVAGKGIDIAKDKIKNFAINAIKKGGKKLAKEALKKGTGVAVKAGVTAATQAAGTTVPILGNIAALVVTKVLPRIKRFLTSLIPRKLKSWLQENKKTIALASIGVFGMGLVFANPLFVLGGVGLGLVGWQLGGFVGLGAAIFTGLVAPFFVRLFGTMLAVFVGIVLLTVFCYLIITSGAYITPYNPNAITTRGPQQSQFFTVRKTFDDQTSYRQENNGNITITYTITITPLSGDLNNISFQSNCIVSQTTQTSQNCPPITNLTVNYGPSGGFPPPPPSLIYSSVPYVITYQQTFSSPTYDDSLITDTFTVTADVGGVRSTGGGSASLALGNPPTDCPAGWPVRAVTRSDGSESYHMSQGPQASPSHTGQEAIDIAPYPNSTHWDPSVDILYATHRGIVSTSRSSTYGNWVRITGNCSEYGGTFSSLQGHLYDIWVNDGETVDRGDPIGIMGNTGITLDGGQHDHYEFVDNPQIIMDQVSGDTFIPVPRVRILGCDLFTCNLRIPLP